MYQIVALWASDAEIDLGLRLEAGKEKKNEINIVWNIYWKMNCKVHLR